MPLTTHRCTDCLAKVYTLGFLMLVSMSGLVKARPSDQFADGGKDMQ